MFDQSPVTNLRRNSTLVLLSQCLPPPPNFAQVRARLQNQIRRVAMGLAASFAPSWALKRAQSMFITPPRFPHSSLERKLIEHARAINVSTPFGEIACWAVGGANAPAVVMCHGWGGRGTQLRAFVPSLLEAGYQVVFFDHIGHGLSEGKQAALVDFWRGLEAVWDYLIDHNIRVEGMVAHSLGSAAVASTLRRSLTRKHANAPTPRVVLIAPPASLIGYSQMFARYVGIPERVRRAMQWRFEQRYGVDWEEFELPHSVAQIDAPALFIHDTEDRETRFAGGLALARTWPDARFVGTHGLGHRRILRDRLVIQHTTDFLTKRVEFARANDWGQQPSPMY